MQPSSRLPSEKKTHNRHEARKRKYSHHRLPSEDSPQQQSVHGLLSDTDRTRHLVKQTPSTPPSNKRSKPANADRLPTSSPRAVSINEMYSFGPKASAASGDASGAIDLTNSSPSRPINGQRKPSRALNPHVGAKKLVVKNLKPNVAWDGKAYLEKVWGQLDVALAVIFKGDPDSVGKEELYRGVENVCRQGGASTLYSRLEARCRDHVQVDMKESLLAKAGLNSIDVLRATLADWAQWKKQMLTIRGIFFFLDRSYLLSSSKPTLAELVPQLFQDNVFEHEALKPQIVDGACELVAADRQGGKQLDQGLFKQAVDMFHDLAVYNASFEPRFLGLTQQYVTAWSESMTGELGVPDYVKQSNLVIAKEMSRCEDFALDNSTRRDLLELLEVHLIVRQEAYLTSESALALMLNNNATAEIEALYSLLSRRRLGAKLRPAFEKWVNETGTTIVLSKDFEDMVIRLLSLKRRLDNMWRTSFQRDESLGHGLRETFEAFINKTQKGDATGGTDNTKVGEMIAKYVDQLLRGGAKMIPEVLTARRASSITAPNQEALASAVAAEKDDDNEDGGLDEDTEMNIQLDQVLDLFRFVYGKAVFEAFYKKDLARRLLMGRSASADAERSMLARLKTECGAGFTHNLEQMFKDVELARDEMSSYKQRLEDRVGYEKGKNVELSVNVLSAAAWPTYPDIPVIIPANIKKAIDDFELHYKSKHSGRKLDWKHALAHCQMRANFNKGTKELVVSSFQAIVMLLFNSVAEGEHVTYHHILSETGLRKCLHPPRVSNRVSLLTSLHSSGRSQTHPPISRLRQTSPPYQTSKRARNQRNRHLHPQYRLHTPEIPRQNQPSSTQRNQRREQGNPSTGRRRPQLRVPGRCRAYHEITKDHIASGAYC